MQQIWDEAWDNVAVLATLVLALALLVWGLVVLSLVFFLISGVVAVYRYKKWLKDAERQYQQVEDEVGAGYESDDVLQAMFGAGVLTDDGFDSPYDWLQGTIFGTNLEETP